VRSWGFNHYAFTICAAAALAGCGGSQPTIGTSSVMPQTFAIAERGHSWMLPEAKSDSLLYISNTDSGTVSVYSYHSHQLVGTLTGFTHPEGQCVDAPGDVWITDGANLVEYAHGGSLPMKTLRVRSGAGALGCSVAPDGDLAVSTPLHTEVPWAILVYKSARGLPSAYTNHECEILGSPGYDNHGNLYVEGSHKRQTRGGSEEQVGSVCELPSEGKRLSSVVFGKRGRRGVNVSAYSSSVMWDGKHLVFGIIMNQTRLYRTIELAGGNLDLVGYTELKNSTCSFDEEYALNFFLVGASNAPSNHREANAALSGNEDGICPNENFSAWKYPAGGKQRWSLDNGYSLGQSVSFPP
jgi:hypothetical protein